MASFEKDEHFEYFTGRITKKLKRRKTDTARQKAQVEGLVAAEVRFRKELAKHKDRDEVLNEFVRYITEVHRSILLALPFFRERSESLRETVGTLFKNKQYHKLINCNLNGAFVQWYLDRFEQKHSKDKIIKAANDVMQRRDELIYENIPIAIHKAKGFWRKTQKSQLTYMDIVQIANEGLINAVDKFCLPYSTSFRPMIIGRITGDLIDAYSKKMVLFPAKDKRRLYHANKVIRFAQDDDHLVQMVNARLPSNFHTDKNQLGVLMNAASHFSLDSPIKNSVTTDGPKVPSSEARDWMTAPEDARPDTQYENIELSQKLNGEVKGLTILAKKILALKGFAVEGALDVQ